jgi:PhnB protein
MSTKINCVVQPYLFYGGRCEEAVEFYRKELGAEVIMLMRFKDSPEPQEPGRIAPGFENKVMHAALRLGDSEIMASDGCGPQQHATEGFALSLMVKTEAEADKTFAALAQGGKVGMPPGKTFYSPRFGMVTDKFGILWMVYMQP